MHIQTSEEAFLLHVQNAVRGDERDFDPQLRHTCAPVMLTLENFYQGAEDAVSPLVLASH